MNINLMWSVFCMYFCDGDYQSCFLCSMLSHPGTCYKTVLSDIKSFQHVSAVMMLLHRHGTGRASLVGVKCVLQFHLNSMMQPS